MPTKKIAGLNPKVAIGVVVVVFVGVYLWYRSRGAGTPTQTQATPQVNTTPPTSSGATDTTGGVQQDLTGTLASLSSFLGALPYTSYSYNYSPSSSTTSSFSLSAGGDLFYGSSGAAPPFTTPSSQPAPPSPPAPPSGVNTGGGGVPPWQIDMPGGTFRKPSPGKPIFA